MNVRSLDDYKKDDPSKKDDKTTNSFTGGEKSGLAVELPKDLDGLSPFSSATRSSGRLPEGSRKVTVYKNGFIVDDGEFRSLEDPKNEKFLAELKEGYAPKELIKQTPASPTPIHVALEDKRSQVYEPPKVVAPKYTLFSGSGVSLSGAMQTEDDTPTVVNTENIVSSVDESRPTTTLQIRFHNGQRHQQSFNQDSTVGDLHNFIMECAPLEDGYKLLYGFPPKEIEQDLSKTLKDCGLLSEMITQKKM